MFRATVRCYEELNDFLPPENKKRDFTVSFVPKSTVGNVLTRVGIPHEQVDLVLVNGVSADFNRSLRGGERVSVYPVFESFDIRSSKRLGPEPLRHLTFVADTDLGSLAESLRFYGFDTLYDPEFSEEELLQLAVSQGRVLLTRREGLLQNEDLTRCVFVRGGDVRAQLAQVFQRLDLYKDAVPLSRCPRCNEPLESGPPDLLAKRSLRGAGLGNPRSSRCTTCSRLCG